MESSHSTAVYEQCYINLQSDIDGTQVRILRSSFGACF